MIRSTHMAPNPINAYQRSDPVIRGPDTSLRGLTQLQVVSTPGMIDYDHDDEACYGYYLMSLTVTWSFYSAHNDNPYTVHITESRHELQPSELLHSELSNSNRGSHVALLRTTTGLLTSRRDLVRIRSRPLISIAN